MKKILLFVASILLSQLAMAQPYLKYELGFKSNIPGEFVPNSDDAVIVKSANIDLPGGSTLIGIAWSNLNEEGYLYITDYGYNNCIFSCN